MREIIAHFTAVPACIAVAVTAACRKRGCSASLTALVAVLAVAAPEGAIYSCRAQTPASLNAAAVPPDSTKPRVATDYMPTGNPKTWHSNVLTYGAVEYRHLYPRVALHVDDHLLAHHGGHARSIAL